MSSGLRDPPAHLSSAADDVRGVRGRGPSPALSSAVHPQGRRLVRHRLSLRGEEEGRRDGEIVGGRWREEDRRDPERHYDRLRARVVVRLDEIRLDEIWLGEVWLGEVWLGEVRLDEVRLDEVRLTITRVPRRARSTAAALPSRTAISRRPLEPASAPRPPRGRSPYVPTTGIVRPATRITEPGRRASAKSDVTRLPKRSTWMTAPSIVPARSRPRSHARRTGSVSAGPSRATSTVTSTSCTVAPAARAIPRIAPFISATYGSRTPKSVVSVMMVSNPSGRRPSAVPIHDEVRHERERLALL